MFSLGAGILLFVLSYSRNFPVFYILQQEFSCSLLLQEFAVSTATTKLLFKPNPKRDMPLMHC